ncbi:MAG: DUF1566 domain-containing protein [Treponema sp.]|nr:DUF1566 domain-containing protein [Treponema sp.]
MQTQSGVFRPHNILRALVLLTLLVFSACANPFFPSAYDIGDRGKGGGIIFYDKGRFTDGWRYLEAAPFDVEVDGMTGFPWASSDYVSQYIYGTETAIGAGKKNTAIIFAEDSYGLVAAYMCIYYSSGGKTDWFLPSRDELNELYKQRGIIGGLSGGYWSSSQYNEDDAWNQDFDNGLQYNTGKPGNLLVRPIRSF